MTRTSSIDQRVTRTREALTQAFMDLVADTDYEAITVAEIIARAEVGRSTFYQHYAGKDDILAAVMEGGFRALADTLDEGPDLVHLTDWLAIFWDNRRAGRVLLTTQSRPFVQRELAARLEPKLQKLARHGVRPPAVDLKLIAAMAADAQIGLVLAWLNGQAHAKPEAMAQALRLATRGLADGLLN